MNLLENKDLLHRLLQQGDMLNTLNGGVVHTSLQQRSLADRIEIIAKAPGLHPEQFQLVLSGNKLIIYSLIIPYSQQEEEESEGAVFGVPMFYREIALPPVVDYSRISAEYEQGQLKINAPYRSPANGQRRINIKNREV